MAAQGVMPGQVPPLRSVKTTPAPPEVEPMIELGKVTVTPAGTELPASRMRLVEVVGASLRTRLVPAARKAPVKPSVKRNRASLASVVLEFCVPEPELMNGPGTAWMVAAMMPTFFVGAAGAVPVAVVLTATVTFRPPEMAVTSARRFLMRTAEPAAPVVRSPEGPLLVIVR